jgi:translation initiation factor 2B subunit (eIF-2B alpha/beta/delta family)
MGAVDDIVAEIAADNRSGASVLARRVVDAFALATRLQEKDNRPLRAQDLELLADQLRKSQPAMAAVRNVAERCLAMAQRLGGSPQKVRGEYLEALENYRTELELARSKVARNAANIIPQDGAVITCSHSSNVVEAMERRAEDLKRVIIMESRPLMEGRTAARALVRAGIPCTVVADAAGPTLVAECDVALVGADSILKDGAVVNKIGTYPLALACKEAGVPFYVACESIKFDGQRSSEDWELSMTRDPAELWDATPPEGLEVVNFYFDLTPAKYVTGGVITDDFLPL